MTKQNTGSLCLGGDNTYSGVTTVTAGVLKATHANALGDSSAATSINFNGSTTTGGQVQISGGISLAEPFTIQGTGDADPWQAAILNVGNSGDTNTLTGDITLSGTTGAGSAAGAEGH